MSLWEVAIKHGLGRGDIPVSALVCITLAPSRVLAALIPDLPIMLFQR
jgi:hypothetical protein